MVFHDLNFFTSAGSELMATAMVPKGKCKPRKSTWKQEEMMGIFGHIFFWWHHTLFLIEKKMNQLKIMRKKSLYDLNDDFFLFFGVFFLSKILIDTPWKTSIGRPWKLMKIDAWQDEFPSLGWYLSGDMLIFGWVIAINCFLWLFCLDRWNQEMLDARLRYRWYHGWIFWIY